MEPPGRKASGQNRERFLGAEDGPRGLGESRHFSGTREAGLWGLLLPLTGGQLRWL